MHQLVAVLLVARCTPAQLVRPSAAERCKQYRSRDLPHPKKLHTFGIAAPFTSKSLVKSDISARRFRSMPNAESNGAAPFHVRAAHSQQPLPAVLHATCNAASYNQLVQLGCKLPHHCSLTQYGIPPMSAQKGSHAQNNMYVHSMIESDQKEHVQSIDNGCLLQPLR